MLERAVDASGWFHEVVLSSRSRRELSCPWAQAVLIPFRATPSLQRARRRLAESRRKILAKPTQILEAARESNRRNSLIRPFQEQATCAIEAQMFGELERRIAAMRAECPEDTARTRPGCFRKAFHCKRLVPVRLDITFRAAHLPRRGCGRLRLESIAIIMLTSEEQADEQRAFQLFDHQLCGCTRSNIDGLKERPER